MYYAPSAYCTCRKHEPAKYWLNGMNCPPPPPGSGARGLSVTWGGGILLIHVFLQQPLQQQHWEAWPRLTPRGKWRRQGLGVTAAPRTPSHMYGRCGG